MRQPQGPAVGFVARSDKLMWGLFNQNLLAFAGDSDREDVNITYGGDRGAWFSVRGKPFARRWRRCCRSERADK